MFVDCIFVVGPENVVWQSARETEEPVEYECSDDPLLELQLIGIYVKGYHNAQELIFHCNEVNIL